MVEEQQKTCFVCGRLRAAKELNFEKAQHHGGRYSEIECIDRKSCERAKRKAERKGARR